MAKTTKQSDDLSTKSYEELEKLSEDIMAELSKENIGLDDASTLYLKGKAVLKEMENRLEKLSKEVTDTIQNA